MSLEDAKRLQFHIVDCACRHFSGKELLSAGDFGIDPSSHGPRQTRRVEKAIAAIFGAEDAVLVRGAGTGAIRYALGSMLPDTGVLLLHDAPVYPTTQDTLATMKAETVTVDFNDKDALMSVLRARTNITTALVQVTRQKPDDSYDAHDVISCIKAADKRIAILTDDNYAVFKIPLIGCQGSCQEGADVSCFSSFKLLGPEGVGIVVGRQEYVRLIRSRCYSGGSQVQGPEAMEVLRGFVYAPVSFAIQAEVTDEILRRLNAGEVHGVRKAFIANAQSRVILVEFEENIADKLLETAEKYGVAPYPVGSESKYEFAPMFYRVSGTFREACVGMEKNTIRINPMRSGADTVLRILTESLSTVLKDKE